MIGSLWDVDVVALMGAFMNVLRLGRGLLVSSSIPGALDLPSGYFWISPAI